MSILGGHRPRAAAFGIILLASGWLGGGTGLAEPPTIAPMPPAGGLNNARILGVIPDYQTVTDPNGQAPPLSRKQKWQLFEREALDPFNIANGALGSALSQMGNETPKYGEGGAALAKRFGAAVADLTTQEFFSAGVLACLLHQDPRYFRKGPGSGVPSRVVYAVSRLVVTRQDSGASAFNASGIGGMLLGIAASNAYYPSASVHGGVMMGRISTSLTGGVVGNLMSEFWPDVQRMFFHRKKHVHED